MKLLLQHYHTLPVIYFCHILAREGTIFVKILDIFEFFCVFMIRSYVLRPISGLTTNYDVKKLQKYQL